MAGAPLWRLAGVNRYEDLHVWQLSVKLRDAIERLTASGRVARDFEFKDQIRDSSSSPPRNIAEGFGRFRPKPFANFLRIARGSLQETRNLLQEGETKRYFKTSDVGRLLRIQVRADKAAIGLIKYLESCPDDFDIRLDNNTPSEPADKDSSDENPEPGT